MPPDNWRRERLNHYRHRGRRAPSIPAYGPPAGSPAPLEGHDGPLALGVDVQPGWQRATIVAAGVRTDGRVGLEVFADLRDSVTAARLVEAVHGFGAIDRVTAICYDFSSGAAAAFAVMPRRPALPWDELKPSVVSASMDVTEMIIAGSLAVDDPLIDAQMAGAARRPVGQDGAFCFARNASLGPIDAFMAMAFAAHRRPTAP